MRPVMASERKLKPVPLADLQSSTALKLGKLQDIQLLLQSCTDIVAISGHQTRHVVIGPTQRPAQHPATQRVDHHVPLVAWLARRTAAGRAALLVVACVGVVAA